MKAIINGLRYDTEKSILVGSTTFGAKGSYDRIEESLHKTPRAGRFFLAGVGGPKTRYARKVEANAWTGGSKIIPLTVEEAREWAEANLAADVIEAHFQTEEA